MTDTNGAFASCYAPRHVARAMQLQHIILLNGSFLHKYLFPWRFSEGCATLVAFGIGSRLWHTHQSGALCTTCGQVCDAMYLSEQFEFPAFTLAATFSLTFSPRGSSSSVVEESLSPACTAVVCKACTSSLSSLIAKKPHICHRHEEVAYVLQYCYVLRCLRGVSEDLP